MQTQARNGKRSRRAEPERLGAAIHAAAEALSRAQRSSGAWASDIDIGPIGVAMQLVVEKHLGVLSERDAAEGARTLLGAQQPDGSFFPHPAAPGGTAPATALCYAGLLSAGVPRHGEPARRAWGFVERRGGVDPVVKAFQARGDMTAIFLLLAGVASPDFLPALPLDLALVPFDRVLDTRIHAGNVMMLFTLMALHERFRGSSRRRGVLGGAVRALERLRLESYLGEYQNADGSWNACAFQTLLMIVGLHAAGASPSSPMIRRALDWLATQKRYGAGGMTVNAIGNEIWSTALALLALVEGGVPAGDARLAAATSYLLEQQIRAPQPRHNQRKAGAVRTGGWPFQQGNETMPDADDTGVVLAALGPIVSAAPSRALLHATDRAVAWLRDMQNPDGGWPCYVWGLPGKKPGPLFLEDVPLSFGDPRAALSFALDPPPELGDPSTEGITGRVLWGLGASGVGRGDPAVVKAIAFLEHQQCETGAWWGRWKTCSLPETATTLTGLRAVGEDMGKAYVRRAVAWLVSCQNRDGGWGETPDAYRSPARAGKGPSMPPLTAYVLLSLLDAGGPADVVERAVAYLLDAQREDGGWPNEGFLHTIVPPDLLYEYPFPAESLPLLALARHRSLAERRR